MANGYAGKILVLNLSDESYETIPTSKYVAWIGGHGMAAALYWDYVEDKTLKDPYDERNVLVLATSPIAGTPTLSGGGRAEMVGIGSQGYPPLGLHDQTWVDVMCR